MDDKCNEEAMSLDQTIFSELKSDLHERRHVDVVLAYYNDRECKTKYTVACHRIALGAKSRLLNKLLRTLDQVDDVRVVLAGGDDGSECKELLQTLYDPSKTAKDIRLWDDNIVTVKAQQFEDDDDDPLAIAAKLETSRPNDCLKQEFFEGEFEGDTNNYYCGMDDDLKVEDDSDPYEIISEDNEDFEGPPKKRQTTRKSPKGKKITESARMTAANEKLALTTTKVQDLVNDNFESLDWKKHPHLKSSAWNKFNLLYCEGERIPYVCCMDCKKVYFHLPSRNSSVLVQHAKKCEVGKLDQVDECEDDEDRPLSVTYMSHLLRTGSDKANICAASERHMHAGLLDRFSAVIYLEKEAPFAVCKGCGRVLVWNRLNGTANLEGHLCTKRKQPGKIVAVDPCQVGKEELQKLVHQKSNLIDLGTFTALASASNKLKQINYKNSITPFLFCMICKRVLAEADAKDHECTTVAKRIVKILKTEPSRIVVQQETILNTMFPFIFPLTLDGEESGFAHCEKCDACIPNEAVRREDFTHRCHRIVANKNIETFSSPNLKPLPKTNQKDARHYECLLCKEVLRNPHSAEVHMRTSHGEGGEKVLCSFCGRGFATIRVARVHEIEAHVTANNPMEKVFQCKKCPANFSEKCKLKRHITGTHAEEAPFVCDLCGKAFKWDDSLKRHMATHGEKSIKCEFCERTFHSKKTYKNHRMTHTGEKPFSCGFCNQGRTRYGRDSPNITGFYQVFFTVKFCLIEYFYHV